MNGAKINVVILGVSCFDGMASSMRIRNLFEPLVDQELITAHNLIYQKNNKEPIGKKGCINDISYKIIGFRLANIFTLFGFVFGGVRFLSKSKKKQVKNILYVFDYPDIKNITFILYARMLGYKIVFEVVEDNRFEAGVGFINNFRIKTSLVLAKTARRFGDALIGISDFLYKKLLELSRGKKPVYHIPISVNLNYFNEVKYKSDKANLQIFYGGSFGTKDGLQYLLAAFDEVSKKHPGIQLILTGAGHKNDMDRVNAQIDQVAYKNNILYKGFLSTEEYYRTLNECDIFCMTRVNSEYANAGFPFKLGEFLASGKAVIATDVGDVSAYLTNNVNALVVAPESIPELTHALSSIIENPEKIEALGREARKTAEKHFDTRKVSRDLFSIFEAI